MQILTTLSAVRYDIYIFICRLQHTLTIIPLLVMSAIKLPCSYTLYAAQCFTCLVLLHGLGLSPSPPLPCLLFQALCLPFQRRLLT